MPPMEIVREKFVDRLLSATDLAVLADMVRRWFVGVAIDAEQSGDCKNAAWIFCVPQQRRKELIRLLSARLPEASFDDTDPDHITVTDPPETLAYSSQITLWRQLLEAPEIANACLLLRMTFRGIVKNSRSHPEVAAVTFALCGAPLDGSFLLKAVWREGLDRGMVRTRHLVPWKQETTLLEAFDLFRERSALEDRDAAAREAYRFFRRRCPPLFQSQGDERRVMQMIRRRVETMDERGPAAFARRCGLPLLAGVGLCVLAAVLFNDFSILAIAPGGAALAAIAVAGRVTWMKLRQIRRHYKSQRKVLGAIHSAPIEYEQIDLSGKRDPTLLRYSTEMVDLGARHIGDLRPIARGVRDLGFRYYATNDALVAIGLLESTKGQKLFFPARATVMCGTRFKDGRRHLTKNRPEYRKNPWPQVTMRCVLNVAGASDVLAAHRQCVEKLTSGGSVPLPPPKTPNEVIERLLEQRAEDRELWKKSPYSWGDAVHAAFQVCRREYLTD